MIDEWAFRSVESTVRDLERRVENLDYDLREAQRTIDRLEHDIDERAYKSHSHSDELE